MKKQALPEPDLRIFQNDNQRQLMQFRDQVPTLTRDMGICQEFLQRQHSTKEFDLVYIGAMDKTRQLAAILQRLLSIKPDLRIAMVGDAPAVLKRQFASQPQILFTGRVHHKDIPGWLERSTVGLNAVPNLRPYKFQTSTKLMEYAAAGLPVLGYLNDWTKNFLSRYSVQYANLDELHSWPPQFSHNTMLPLINDELLWEKVIARSGVENYLPD
ncbi:glycosyltransferase [Rheinheimera sp.]|uniref:glycosyltransferase n=1 Tax=Rheinheimera sp. TaxID=1869214 RepID=UPI00307D0533